jgi:hypothetical protein
MLVFFIAQRHRFVLIRVKKYRVIGAGKAAELPAKRLKLAFNELLAFCTQVNTFALLTLYISSYSDGLGEHREFPDSSIPKRRESST